MINKELKDYIERNIIPKYKEFDGGHNIDHVETVINESLVLAKEYDADYNMCYTIAAYHDIGIAKGRELHHINSALELRRDKKIKEWFTDDEINTMAEAIEDHRASSKSSPRSIYGAIVAEADRDLRCEVVFRRCISFGLKEIGKNGDYELHKKRTLKHLKEKYGLNGYMKLHLNSRKNAEGLIKIREILDSEEMFEKQFNKSWNEIKKNESR